MPICNVCIKTQKPEYRPFPLETDKSLGACLKRRRLELEWTQGDCANHFGVLKDSYQKWEWNQITPVIYRKKLICDFLGFNYWDDGTGFLANLSLLYRIEYKLSKADLSNLIGVSSRAIERIEAKEKNVSKLLRQGVLEFINEI